MNELTQRGIAALKAGDRLTARKLLASAVQQDANDTAAWLWLAGALDGEDERITCLRQVLRLDPGNQAAARGLAQILERRTRPASQSAEAARPPAQSPAAPPAKKPVDVSGSAAIYEPPAPVQSAAANSSEPPAPVQSSTRSTAEPPAPVQPAPAADAWRGLTWDAADEPAASDAAASSDAASDAGAFETAETDRFEMPQAITPVAAAAPEVYATEAVVPEAVMPEAYAAEAAAPETAAAVPAEAMSTAVPYQPKRSKESYLPMRRIFTTRPSLVPSLLCFWLFFFGSVIAGNLLARNPIMQNEIGLVPQSLVETIPQIKMQPSALFSLAMGIILELVVIYATLRIFTIRYELTNQMLTLRFRGKRARVPVEYIYNADCKQSLIQKAIGTGHLDLDLAVNGELAHVRLRDIPDCKKRRDQIMYLVQDLS